MSVRICPKCGFEDSPCWKRSFQGNPNGDIDVSRIDWLPDWEPEIAKKVENKKGEVVIDGIFAYYLGKRAIWVKRVPLKRFLEGGMSVFNISHESGKPKKEAK
jgi:hypothetical protein